MADASIRPNPRKGKPRAVITPTEWAHAQSFCAAQRVVRCLPAAPPHPTKVRKTARDEYAFDTITPESAYWLGLLMADGAVVAKPAPNIVLQLTEPDTAHVWRFRAFMGSDCKVTPLLARVTTQGWNRNRAERMVIYSDRLVDVVGRYGIEPNKSRSAEAALVEHHPDFWRGVTDGDGSIRSRNFRLFGSQALMAQFASFVRAVAPWSSVTATQHLSIFKVEIHGKTAEIVADCLYHNDGPALDRKRRAALTI